MLEVVEIIEIAMWCCAGGRDLWICPSKAGVVSVVLVAAAHIWGVFMSIQGTQQELWCPRRGILEIDECGLGLTPPLAFGDRKKARCPAMFGIVPYNKESSHVPHDFWMFPQIKLTFMNVNQQYWEHNNSENKF